MSEIQEQYIAIEELLAAAIDYNGGRLEISSESFNRSWGGKVIAMNYDYKKDVVVLTLVDKEDVDYGDE
jgi:hypothetical protein